MIQTSFHFLLIAWYLNCYSCFSNDFPLGMWGMMILIAWSSCVPLALMKQSLPSGCRDLAKTHGFGLSPQNFVYWLILWRLVLNRLSRFLTFYELDGWSFDFGWFANFHYYRLEFEAWFRLSSCKKIFPIHFPIHFQKARWVLDLSRQLNDFPRLLFLGTIFL